MAGLQRTVIAEAAIAFKNFFIRVDISTHDPISKTLQLVEVKSSSVDEEVVVKRLKTDEANLRQVGCLIFMMRLSRHKWQSLLFRNTKLKLP